MYIYRQKFQREYNSVRFARYAGSLSIKKLEKQTRIHDLYFFQLWVPTLLEHQVCTISYCQIETEYVKIELSFLSRDSK